MRKNKRMEKLLKRMKRAKKANPPKNKKRRFSYAGGGLDHSISFNGSNGSADGGSVGESKSFNNSKQSLLQELFSDMKGASLSTQILQHSQLTKRPLKYMKRGEEEIEKTIHKVDQARSIFMANYSRPDITRNDIISKFMKDVGVTRSTAVSYYTRFLKELGSRGQKVPVSQPKNAPVASTGTALPKNMPTFTTYNQSQKFDINNPDTEEEERPEQENPEGIIRTVKNAHLVYKKQRGDGTFEELWIYNTSPDGIEDMKIRREILSGTDIPPKKTESPDGKQKYEIYTIGNAQYLHIIGLPN